MCILTLFSKCILQNKDLISMDKSSFKFLTNKICKLGYYCSFHWNTLNTKSLQPQCKPVSRFVVYPVGGQARSLYVACAVAYPEIPNWGGQNWKVLYDVTHAA